MFAHTAFLPVQPHPALPSAQVRLAAMADSGFLGVGVPSQLGGQGGQLPDLFRDQTAHHWLQRLQHPDLLIFAGRPVAVGFAG